MTRRRSERADAEHACGCVPVEPYVGPDEGLRRARAILRALPDSPVIGTAIETVPHRDPHEISNEDKMRWSRGELEVVRDPQGRL